LLPNATFAHESRALKIPLHRSCLIREVLLYCKDQPVVFARSVISDKAIKASKHQLTKLGTIPLGHLLFNNAKVDLNTRQIARLTIDKEQRFARRTLYQLNGEAILVAEFFLSPPW
jgi:chorismate--pyruvate lyase